jgi:amino acid transporter
VNAIIITYLIGCGLALIPLGSTVAFLNIQTIGNVGLMTSYIICIASRMHHRSTIGPYGHLQKPPPFFLGKIMGHVVNLTAILFLFCFLISSTFPPAPHPTVESMNWSSLALGATITIAATCYIRLHKTYLGPDLGHQVERGHNDTESTIKAFGGQV